MGENRSERAIIILDLVNDFAHSEGKNFIPATKDMVSFVEGELKYFRERMRPVIFCKSQIEEFKNLSDEENEFRAKVIQSLSPRAGEICVEKSRPNAFFDTELSEVLVGLKVKTVTIVGVSAHTSVINTAAAALDRGFSVVVPETCVCSKNEQDQAAALRLISTWLNDI